MNNTSKQFSHSHPHSYGVKEETNVIRNYYFEPVRCSWCTNKIYQNEFYTTGMLTFEDGFKAGYNACNECVPLN